jgi:hypothetical protein
VEAHGTLISERFRGRLEDADIRVLWSDMPIPPLAVIASKLAMTDLNTTLVGAFLDNLEKARANSSRSRNLRPTAIRSFFRYTAMACPEHSAGIQRVLAIPPKRQSTIGGFPDET